MKKYLIVFILFQTVVMYAFPHSREYDFIKHASDSNFQQKKEFNIISKKVKSPFYNFKIHKADTFQLFLKEPVYGIKKIANINNQEFDYSGGIKNLSLPDCDEECNWEVNIENNGECEWLRYAITKDHNNKNKLILICDATKSPDTQTKQVTVKKNGAQIESFTVTRTGKIIFESLVYDIRDNGGTDPVINLSATAIGGKEPSNFRLDYYWIVNDQYIGELGPEVELNAADYGLIQQAVRIICVVEDVNGQKESKMISFGVN